MFFLLQILHHEIPSIAFPSFLVGILNGFLTFFFHPKHKKVGWLSSILKRTKVLRIDLVWQIYHYPKLNTFYETICYNGYREYHHIFQEPWSICHTYKNTFGTFPEEIFVSSMMQELLVMLKILNPTMLHINNTIILPVSII